MCSVCVWCVIPASQQENNARGQYAISIDSLYFAGVVIVKEFGPEKQIDDV